MKIMTVLFVLFNGLLMCSIANSEVLFFDGFETKNFTTTNADGFSWGGTNYTSLITPNGRVYGASAINPPDQLDQITPNHFEAYTGDVALRFRYNIGNSMSEQRFDLGGAYREIWISYWIRVPINYSHGTIGSAFNQKWLAIWMQAYESTGPEAVWGIHPDGTGGSTISICHNSGNGGCGSYQQTKPFISVPQDRDRWMQVVYQLVASTSSVSNDGAIRFWRRWENESTFTKLHELTGLNLPICGTCPNGWHAGYLMGWANATYTEDTQWMLDDFTVATSSLLAAQKIGLDAPTNLEIK